MNWFEKLRQKKAWCPAHAQTLNSGTVPVNAADTPDTAGGPVERRTRFFTYMSWAVVAIAFLSAYLAIPYLPETIPIHWDAVGNANGFTSGVTGAFMMPCLMTGFLIILMVIPRFDAMKGTFGLYRDIYALVIFSIAVFMLAIHFFTLLTGMGYDIPIMVFMPVMMGMLFMVIGSLMPHIGRNTTMGFRLPWTLRDPVVWQRTHEYGAKVMIGAGVLCILSSLAGIYAIFLMLVIILVSTGYVTVWSYRFAKEREKNGVYNL